MPASKRDLIIDDVVALLAAGAVAAGMPTAKDAYTFQLTGDSIIAFPVDDTVERAGGRVTGGPVQKRTLVLAVECRGQGTVSVTARKRADAIASYVETTVGGKSKGVTEGSLYHVILVARTVFALEQADHAYCLARVEVEVEYQSRVDDPASWA